MKTTTPMTPDLFYEWKKKKIEERDANLAAQQAERAKNDRMRYIHYPFLLFMWDVHVVMKVDTILPSLLLIWLHCFLLQCSGRELFLSNASLFVDDAEAYEKYQREPENDETEQNVSFLFLSVFCPHFM